MNTDPRPSIPGFEFLDILGERSLGTVYKARQVSLNRVVAIRIMQPGPGQTQAYLERMEAQAQAATLHHANITHVLEAGQHEGLHYLVMEYVSGYSLASKLKRQKPVTAAEALVMINAVASALNHAWARASIIHGDLRPENLLVDDDGTVKVSDFLGFSLQRRLGSLTTKQLSGNPYYDYSDANIAEPTQVMDMEALGRVIFHAMTGNLLPRENEEAQLRTAFLQLAQLHPDPGTRDLAPQLGNLLIQLVCPGPEQALATWEAVSQAASRVTVAPIPKPSQGLTPLPAAPLPQDLPALADTSHARPKKVVIRKSALPEESMTLHAKKKKNGIVALAITLLIWGGIAYGTYLADQKFDIGMMDQAKSLWSQLMAQVKPIPDEEERVGDSLPPDSDDLTLPPPMTGEDSDLGSERIPMPEDSGMDMMETIPDDNEPFSPTNAFEDQPTVAEFHEYASGMEQVFDLSLQRAYEEASEHASGWLARYPNHHYMTVMQANIERMASAAALFQLLEDNSANLTGQTITHKTRKGVIQSIARGTIRVKQTIKGVEVQFEFPLRRVNHTDFAKLLKVGAPDTYDQNMATFLLSAGRFGSGSEHLDRMIRPREAKSELVTWKEEWQQAWNNIRARRALVQVERLIREGDLDRASKLLDKIQVNFQQTDVLQWAGYEKVATLEEELRGLSTSPEPSEAERQPRPPPVTLNSEMNNNSAGKRDLGRPPMFELDIKPSKKTRQNKGGDIDDQKQSVSVEVTLKNKELRESYENLTSEIYVVAESVTDRDIFKLIIKESRYGVSLPAGDMHSFETKTVKLLFDDNAYAQHGFSYYGYLYLLKDRDGNVLISKASKGRLSNSFSIYSGLEEQTDFTM